MQAISTYIVMQKLVKEKNLQNFCLGGIIYNFSVLLSVLQYICSS